MDLHRFSARIAQYSVKPDNSTFLFHVHVQYGQLSWVVDKRYSEFCRLQSDMRAMDITALPALPPKTLFRPQDFLALKARLRGLQSFLTDCLRRPDTRTSPPMMSFLRFTENTGEAPEFARPEMFASAIEGRFAVSALRYDPTQRLLFVAMEEASQMARLGRAWSLIEPEELGMVAVWALDADNSDWISFKNLCDVPFTQRIRCLAYWGKGKIYAFGFSTVNGDAFELLPFDKPIDAHHEEMVLCLDLVDSIPYHLTSDGSVTNWRSTIPAMLTVGYDHAIRVVEFSQDRGSDEDDLVSRGSGVCLQVVAGGRLASRLDRGAKLTKGALLVMTPLRPGEKPRRVAFVGSSTGQVLVVDVTTRTQFLYSLSVAGESVCAIKIDAVEDRLYVSQGEQISVLSVASLRDAHTKSELSIADTMPKAPKELLFPVEATLCLSGFHSSAANCRGVSLEVHHPDPPLTLSTRVYVGHAGGSISLFTLDKNHKTTHRGSWRAHFDDPFGRANVMAIQTIPDQDMHLLLSGASEGATHLWKGLDDSQIDVLEREEDLDTTVTMKAPAADSPTLVENSTPSPQKPLVPRQALPRASPFLDNTDLEAEADRQEVPSLTPVVDVKWSEDDQGELYDSLANAVW
ncbi:MAG: hypothetical protein KVP17_002706 [Porospora cf. gigantea B]|uniref:uncharacterized protein n=2 Tax=Porospora cf. gigantea B TaxID=2853592 RepID=UPI003571D200|nr:MAG: hypothetical protein KVP17_002706 [Porospora cf. gigantea B]